MPVATASLNLSLPASMFAFSEQLNAKTYSDFVNKSKTSGVYQEEQL